jgi:hypothetical protein
MSTWCSSRPSRLAMAIMVREDGSLRNWRVGVEIVNPLYLAEPLCYKPSFVAHDLARGVLLCLENPLGADDICSWWCMFEGPSAGCAQGGELLSNGLLPERPVGASFCLSQVAWLERFRLRGFSRLRATSSPSQFSRSIGKPASTDHAPATSSTNATSSSPFRILPER